MSLSNKKVARFTNFNNEWLKNPKYEKWLSKCSIGEFYAKCGLCNSRFTIKYRGESELITHLEGKNHQENQRLRNKNEAIKSFFVKKASKEEDIISTAEISHVYHSIMHHHSYLSADCGVNLMKIIFKDSKIAKQMTCGRTKATAITTNVLAPHSIEYHLTYLIENNIKYSISSDASNKLNIKMFPLAIQYFHKERGIMKEVVRTSIEIWPTTDFDEICCGHWGPLLKHNG